MNNYGISSEIYNEIIETFKKIPELCTVIIFGSRARGDYKKTSDIDLAVQFANEDKKLKLIRLLDEIKCVLKFDVINLETISNKELIENIKKDGIVIYENIKYNC